MKEPIKRRSFLEKSALAGLGTALSFPVFSAQPQKVPGGNESLRIHIFSKHLQFLNYREMADAAAEIGFDGVDLAVRPKGHVLPEKVGEDLPLAVAALKQAGFQPEMMTTAVRRADEVYTKKVLETAAKLGIKYYRLGYYKYPDDQSIPETISKIRKQLKELSHLNKSLEIKGAYQNHAGLRVGANIWEIWEMLKDVDNGYLGCQYDIRHATVEGGRSWQTGLKLIRPKINTLVLKDFRWEKANGKWELLNTPIGEGMVDFTAYFKLLKKYQLNVPVSMHCEYDLGGAEHGRQKISVSPKTVFQAMKKDLNRVRELWSNA
ncbi:sugar phosphate isomerase/epimerase family protein [Fulvivirgaceae bacterium BMA12]|uniref:Sugar phosphate isomerase/epimerase family protein n=1 Tax=Agaribacillus aureus TaxID=3051825 RepID=A0ABT8L2D5_9BACT|nr:sugar phosphate isomerase/epimerase family protein [Fulvivirgaceae bacterium BMA12]